MGGPLGGGAPSGGVRAGGDRLAERLGVRRRIVTVLEGESLINDGTALVLYRVAVGAVVFGTFSFVETGLRFVFGVLVAWSCRV